MSSSRRFSIDSVVAIIGGGEGEGAIVVVPLAVIVGIVVGVVDSIDSVVVSLFAIIGGGEGAIVVDPLAVIVGIVIGDVVDSVVAIIGGGDRSSGDYNQFPPSPWRRRHWIAATR